MKDWTKKLFIERSDLFLKLMNQRWSRTEALTDGMVKVLGDFGITKGSMLDLCCGNGRISVHMAKKGFRAVGIDMSKDFLDDALKKAIEHGISERVTFIQGDVRKLKSLVRKTPKRFDIVVNAWTSIGYSSPNADLSMFRQARESSRKGAVLFVVETMHSEYLSLKFTPTSYTEIDGMLMLENRKYDPKTSQMNAAWSFYKKRGEDLEFIDRIEYETHTYSINELCILLRKAGWETVATYESLTTLQPMNPLTSMNIVAKAV